MGPTWGTGRFLATQLDLAPGATELSAPTAPGLGLDVDWAAVDQLSIRHSSTDAR